MNLKKIIMCKKAFSLFVVLLFSISATYAQDSSDVILHPQKGEFGIGFNTVPVFSFFSFVDNKDDELNRWDFFGTNTFRVKYLISERTALRASLSVNSSYNRFGNDVFDDTQNTPDARVTDYATLTSQFYATTVGVEWRKGSEKIEGVFGTELAGMFYYETTKYDYGNSFGLLNQAPTSTTWAKDDNSRQLDVQTSSPSGERLKSYSSGAQYGIGIRPFIGVEYFLASKISLGVEFGWYFMYSYQESGLETHEYFIPSVNETRLRQQPTPQNRTYATEVDNAQGTIMLMFYF